MFALMSISKLLGGEVIKHLPCGQGVACYNPTNASHGLSLFFHLRQISFPFPLILSLLKNCRRKKNVAKLLPK